MDKEFVRASDPESMLHLVLVLDQVCRGRTDERQCEGALVSYLRAHRFVSRGDAADGRVGVVLYFQDDDTGMMMLIPGLCGQGDVARFHLVGWHERSEKN